MIENLKATYSNGVFKLENPVDLDEGAEVVISVSERQEGQSEFRGLRSSFGGWKGIVDCEQLIDEIYAYRSTESRSRPLPELK